MYETGNESFCIRGLPFMTFAVGGGRWSPRSRQKKQNQLICDSDKGEGEGVRKSEKFAWKLALPLFPVWAPLRRWRLQMQRRRNLDGRPCIRAYLKWNECIVLEVMMINQPFLPNARLHRAYVIRNSREQHFVP